ncbi:MAG TPA: MmcQ/YjbR family DNA-binding protein [Puia sp.]|jgi:predicted DNA-binding protein (MmcQ/YjbR family)|nr:MmcQ/YjbR family DNA-binding protein [Puia sp.]
MYIEKIRSICIGLPAVTEDIKWGNDLCFMVGGKMFCVILLESPFKVSFKVIDEEFEILISKKGILAAPYAARHKWVLVEDTTLFKLKEWEQYLIRSYNLVKAKLPKKTQQQIDQPTIK